MDVELTEETVYKNQLIRLKREIEALDNQIKHYEDKKEELVKRKIFYEKLLKKN